MDYSKFRFQAVVDFIEVEIETTHSTKGHTVAARCAVSFADPQNEGPGKAATVFRIRLYDLDTFADFQGTINRIKAACDLQREPVVTMIEVAFDGYSDPTSGGLTLRDLAELAGHFVYRLASPVSQNTRTYRDHKGSAAALPRTFDGLVREMEIGRNVGIGNATDDLYQHAYVKITDHNKKPIVDALQHRARFEVRLAGEALPFPEILSWQGFKFESLSKHINFRRKPENLSAFESMLIDAKGANASHRSPACQKRRRDGKVIGGGTTAFKMPADTHLNTLVRSKLRDLSRRWSPAKRSQNHDQSARKRGDL